MAQYDTVYASKISLSWEIVVFSLVFVNQTLTSTLKVQIEKFVLINICLLRSCVFFPFILIAVNFVIFERTFIVSFVSAFMSYILVGRKDVWKYYLPKVNGHISSAIWQQHPISLVKHRSWCKCCGVLWFLFDCFIFCNQ